MTTLRLNKFLGEAPKIAEELLPDTVATSAVNVKIYSGNLSLLENDTTQRIYYTGDGAPKQTDYTLATSGTNYPTSSRPLGVVAPTAAPTSTVTTIGPSNAAIIASTHRARSNNIATVTLAAVNFGVGAVVTTTLFGDASYNAANVTVTAVTSTTFSYNDPGGDESIATDSTARR